MKIYVASSWRNRLQQTVVEYLRVLGHEVYDFRNPAPGNHGFGWKQVAPDWRQGEAVTAEQLAAALEHPIAANGYKYDADALSAADVCVLVLPCGRSAHLEAGFAAGLGKRVIVYMPQKSEPELMYKLGGGNAVGRLSDVAVLLGHDLSEQIGRSF